jgi:anti-sigma factor RsiW
MINCQYSDCLETMLDMLCYEFVGRRLSPEMRQALEEHLKQCPRCRNGMHNFFELMMGEQRAETVQ